MRRPTAVTAALAGAALTVLAATMGWAWYVEGPWVVIVTAAAGLVAGARLGPRSAAVAVAVLALVAVMASQRFDAEVYHWLDDAVFFSVVAGGPAIAGAAVATRARQVRRLELLEHELTAQRALETQAAALEERLRIRSTVHERIGERIAAIALLAEGARLGGDGAVIAAIETEARTVLDRLRETIGVLRDRPSDAGDLEHTPSPRVVDGGADTAPISRWSEPRSGPAAAPTSPRPRVVALAVPAGLALSMSVEVALAPQARGPLSLNVLAAALVTAPLAVRRSRPWLAVLGTCALAVLMGVWLTPPSDLVTGVALVAVVLYTVGAWIPGRGWPLAWLAVAASLVLLEEVATARGGKPEESDVGVVLLWSAVAVGLGRLAAGWQTRLQRIRSAVDELDRGRAVDLRLTAAREREDAASRLHDTVAHAMSVICLQAGAQQRGATDAHSALSVIATVAEESLAELRLEVDASTSSPLDARHLAEIGRRLGVDVEVDVNAAPVGPHGALAQRVIRESLVNITRHAPGAQAAVRVVVEDGDLRVEVDDDGPAVAGPTDLSGSAPRGVATLAHRGTGTGLRGLRAAVCSVGGSLDWGVRDGGGFRVAAVLPREPR